MLADGTARPGLTASYPSQFVGRRGHLHADPASPLVTDPVVLDASLQPGYAGSPIVELDGSWPVPAPAGSTSAPAAARCVVS